MLVLDRGVLESLIIGDDVEVKVLSVVGNAVRIGVDAPLDTVVHREEVYERIQPKQESREQKGSGLYRSKRNKSY